ncbi:hypothetical protein B7463_g1760, partial [Scytalidium lignicola]
MRAATTTSLLALSATALAQYNNASSPFALVLSSSNSAYDGHSLAPCHEGAAIEALCVGGVYAQASAQTYTFNSTTSLLANPPTNGGGADGILIFSLPVQGVSEPEAFSLQYNPASNVAVPLFEPGTESVTYVSFDASDKLNIQGAVDNGTIGSPSVPYYRWQVCKTFVGYSYTTLAWIVGSGASDNPTCEPVTVKRVFA